jgi:PAS domain S-box-containing protein
MPKEKEDAVEEEKTGQLFPVTALSKFLEKRFPGWRESMQGKKKWYQSLTARICLLVLFAILVTSTGISVYFVLVEKGHKEKDLVEHGTSLASMLAQYAGHGIAAEDENMLISLLIGTDANPDIAYAAILGPEKDLLLFRSKDQKISVPEARAFGHGLPPGKAQHRTFLNRQDGHRYVDFLVPVRNIPGSDQEGRFAPVYGQQEILGYVQLGLSQEGHNAGIWKFLGSITLTTLLLMCAGVGVAIAVARRISLPIRDLVAFTRTVTEERLEETVEVGGSGETDELAQSFNEMLSRFSVYRDQAEQQTEELRTVKEQLSWLLASLPIVVFASAAEGNFDATYISGNIEEITGYPPGDFTGRPGFWSGNIHPEDAPGVFAELPKLTEQGTLEHEYRFRKADGSYVWFRDSLRLVRAPDGGASHVVGVREDRSRSRRDAEVRALLGMAVEQAAETIMITDTEGTIEYVNPAFEKISGYDAEEVIGKTPRIQKSGHHEEEFYKEMWDTLRRGESWSGSIVNRRRNGNLFQEMAVISPVRGTSGKIEHYVAVKRDVTTEVELEEQLRQSQKMEAIGKLAGGIAHDFNNLLVAVTGYSDILLGRLGQDDPGRKEIEEIRNAGDRAAALTRQLLAFGRRQLLNLKVVDLNETIWEMENMLRRVIGEDISIMTFPGNNLWPVRVDPGQVEQVIMNLVVNSRDAMPGGGKLTIETSNVRIDEEYARRRSGVKPGEYVMLAVSDTGRGMSPEVQGRIFEPFFTTKDAGKGTGLGLSTVYGIVKQTGGNVWVYSEEGMGSAFKVYLPAVPDSEKIAGKSEKREKRSARGTETLLLAEDEEVVRNIIRAVLGSNGYQVIEARDGREALEIADRHQGPIDLLLTDVIMPEINGKDLATCLVEKHPEAKVLYMSGYTENAIVHHGVLDAGTAFLQKPFRADALAQKVREVLDTA